jgi:hypothetical protein
MDEREAIEQYNLAGERRGPDRALGAVLWPDIAIDADNLARLAEGVLAEHCDCAQLVFGDACDSAALGDRLSEAWRTDGLEVRFAPEGVFVRSVFTVRVAVAAERDDEEPLIETLCFRSELCLSFTHRHHTRPFVDFMGGEVRRGSEETVQRIDPFAREISPVDAVAWGLNGA